MEPEQAKGKYVDRRADIWAFGCVLYEMLTGQRAFVGVDLSETLASVLSKDVDWSALPSDTPSQIRSLLRRCLQRNVRERLRDIGDAYLQVRDAIGTPEGGVRVAKRSRLAIIAPWAVAAAAILAALGFGWIAWRRPAAPAAAVTRFIIEPPKTAGLATGPVLAADGTFVLYTADRLYLQSLSEFEPRALPATENAQMPLVSPDGRWVVFYADGKLKKIAVAGGDPIAIADVNIDQPSGAWTRDNRILFAAGLDRNAPLTIVSADGGVPTPVSTLAGENRESSHRWPEPLPDGRHVLFTIWYAGTGIVQAQIAVLDLETGKHRPLFAGATPRYADGHLIYYRAGTYHIVRFDPATQTVLGDSRPILPDALAMAPMGNGPRPVSVSDNGTIAYRAGDLYPERAISWIHRDGREQTTSLRLRVNGFALAPDGQRLAFGRPEAGTSQIWIHDFVRGDAQRLTSEGYNLMPEWHPDGQRVAFVSVRRGYFEAVEQHVDGSQSAIMPSELGHEVLAWLPDGQRAIIKEVLADSTTAVTLMPADRKQRIPLVSGAFFKGHARVSPDSRWLATCASPGGARQVFVRPLSATGGLQQVTARAFDHCYPLWSSRSKQLSYIASNELVVATYEERNGRFVVLKEDVIAPVPTGTVLMGLTADGERYLVGKRASESASGIRVLVNGLETLMNAPAR
jgi:eukaryotic-like serine/threonine-protein kinase